MTGMELARLPYPGHCHECKSTLRAGAKVAYSTKGATCRSCVALAHTSQGTPGGRTGGRLFHRDMRSASEKNVGRALESTPRQGWGILHNCVLDEKTSVSHLVVNKEQLVLLHVEHAQVPLGLDVGRLREGKEDRSVWMESTLGSARLLQGLTHGAGGEIAQLRVLPVLVVAGQGLSFMPCTLRGVLVTTAAETSHLVGERAERRLHAFLGRLVTPT